MIMIDTPTPETEETTTGRALWGPSSAVVSSVMECLVSLLLVSSVFLLLGQEQIEHYCQQEYHSHTVVGKYRTHNLGEDVEHVCGLGETESHAQREAHDNHVALRESGAGHHAETGKEDAAKHHDGAASKYGLGYGGKHIAYSWEYAAHNHYHGTHAYREAVDYARHGSQTHVLAERGDGGTAE